MDIDQLATKVQSLEARVTALESPVVPSVPTASTYQFDADGFLMGATSIGGARIDPVVGPDCPRTVTPSETGHTLSIARPDLREMFMGYCIRVSAQAHGNHQIVGALAMGSDWLFDKWGGFNADGSNWPFAADRFFNGESYGDAVGDPGVVPGMPGTPPVGGFPGEEPL